MSAFERCTEVCPQQWSVLRHSLFVENQFKCMDVISSVHKAKLAGRSHVQSPKSLDGYRLNLDAVPEIIINVSFN
jgi:hypothetical protein